MHHKLIDLVGNQVLRGNKVGHELVAEAWNEMVKTIQWDIGLILTKML